MVPDQNNWKSFSVSHVLTGLCFPSKNVLFLCLNIRDLSDYILVFYPNTFYVNKKTKLYQLTEK